MKLRIKGDSLRLRVTQTELARLIAEGRIEETIHFGPAAEARLTYALETGPGELPIQLRYEPGEVAVVLSHSAARQWAGTQQVGIEGEIDAGQARLALIVEKDFACLEHREEDVDAFPHPKQGVTC
jgi:hypothetical protein